MKRTPRAEAMFTRALDLVVALPLALASTPVLAALAIGIRCVSPGPPWYSQPRRGRADRLIKVPKLRTMHMDCDRLLVDYLAARPAAAHTYQRTAYLSSDPRIAGPVALFARRFGLDELPQLWSVVAGDMALVGPRPLEEHLRLSLFCETERAARGEVRPGLSGLWQVRRRDASIRGLRRYDLFYLQRRSWRLDLWIIAQTPLALLAGRGA